ncbi:MAG: hypothetical protein KAS32_29710 [Candidatus Peribacteraceae bacterium]|nr:hypothetical protein [Candidatus Peribacteraceae bacterium]
MDFESVAKPTEAQRLSFYGSKVQKCIDEHNNALPAKLGVAWKKKYIATQVAFGEAKKDAIYGTYEYAEPPWSVDVDTIQDSKVTWHPSLNKDNEGSVYSYLLRLREVLKADGATMNEISILLGKEINIAKTNCFNGGYWD